MINDPYDAGGRFYRNKDHRRERHMAYLERLLDSTLEELERYKDIHKRQEKLEHECTALIKKYNSLLDMYLRLEKRYAEMLSLVDEGGMN